MKKSGILLGLFLVLGLICQCTEDEEVEAGINMSNSSYYMSGEEGDQEIDNSRD